MRYLILSFIGLFFYGCTSTAGCVSGFGSLMSGITITSSLPIEKYIDKMAKEIYPSLGGGNVVITDFVNTNTYQSSNVGILLAEMLKSSINRYTNARILQVDFGKAFKLTPGGLIVLTRNAKKVMPINTSVSVGLVGTYNITYNSFYIFIKRINLRTGTVIHSTSQKISFSCIGEYIIDRTPDDDDDKSNVFNRNFAPR